MIRPGLLALTLAVLAACSADSEPSSTPRVTPSVEAGEDAQGYLGPCGADARVPESPVYAFFSCADDDALPPLDVYPVPRPAQAADPVSRLDAALIGLLLGPTEEEMAAGYSSMFSPDTAGALNGVAIDADGTAVVDFADFRRSLGSASTSAGSEVLLAELNATVFQVPEVTAVDYRIGGSCQAFWEWLQRPCQIVERPES